MVEGMRSIGDESSVAEGRQVTRLQITQIFRSGSAGSQYGVRRPVVLGMNANATYKDAGGRLSVPNM